MIKKSPAILKIAFITSFLFFIMPLAAAQAQEKSLNYKNQNLAAYWPIAPLDEKEGQTSIYLDEPLYKRSKKIWHDLPYTDTDIKLKALKGFLWIIKFMNNENNLKENENNYLTMLSTTFCSARDPYLRRMALEEAKNVAARLIANNFISRYEKDNDFDSLMEYLTLFNHLGIVIPELKEKTIMILEKEKQNIIDRVTREKQASLDGDELYNTMLLTYYITNLKNNFPHISSLNDLPDLRDFFEILGKYKYHLESVVSSWQVPPLEKYFCPIHLPHIIGQTLRPVRGPGACQHMMSKSWTNPLRNGTGKPSLVTRMAFGRGPSEMRWTSRR